MINKHSVGNDALTVWTQVLYNVPQIDVREYIFEYEQNYCHIVLIFIATTINEYCAKQNVIQITHWGRVTHICVSKVQSLDRIMVCRLVVANPLSEPMLECC